LETSDDRIAYSSYICTEYNDISILKFPGVVRPVVRAFFWVVVAVQRNNPITVNRERVTLSLTVCPVIGTDSGHAMSRRI